MSLQELHSPAWHSSAADDGTYLGNPGGLVFMANNNGMAMCIDAATGKEVWKERLGEDVRATPLVANGHVYFFTMRGRAIIIEASREFTTVEIPAELQERAEEWRNQAAIRAKRSSNDCSAPLSSVQ